MSSFTPHAAAIDFKNRLAYVAGTFLAGVPGARGLLRAATIVTNRTGPTRRFHERVVDVLARRLASSGSCYRRTTIAEVPLLFDVSDVLIRQSYFGGRPHETRTVEFVKSVLRSGDTVIDVGANRGYFTVLCGLLVGATGRVFAFEPIPRAIESLRRHVEMNGIADRVVIAEAAVADVDGQVLELHLGADPETDVYASLQPSEFVLSHGWLDRARTIPVKVRTLDSWCRDQRPGSIRLLKIDVEGAEAAVVRGMETLLRCTPPDYIICEGTWGEPAHNTFCDRGYRPERLECTGDYGNILYTRGDVS